MTEDVKRAVDGLRHCAAASIANVQGCDTCPVIGECLDIDYPHRVVALVDQLTAELEQVTRERDAAVQDLKADEICCQCVHWPTLELQTGKCEVSEKARGKDGLFRCKNKCWQWRGVCAGRGQQ